MDALTRAFNDSSRSFLACKASVSQVTEAMLGHGPGGALVQSADFSKAQNQLDAFKSVVYSSIRPIAQRIAAQKIHVSYRTGGYRKRKAAVETEWGDYVSHPILSILADPNELSTGWDLIWTTVVSLELTGRQLWWCPVEGREKRRRIYPLPSSWIVDIRGTTSFETFVVRPANHAGDPLEIDSSEVCYFHYPHPGDPRKVYSPLMAAAAAVNCDEDIETSQRVAFRHGINGNVAIILGKSPGASGSLGGGVNSFRPTLSGSQRRQLVESVKAIYSGVYNSAEPWILDSAIEDVKKISALPSEMAYPESSRLVREKISLIFGTNEIINGRVEGANRASSLAAEQHFATYTLNPKISLLSEVLTAWLVPMFEESSDTRVWIEPVTVRDDEMRVQWASLMAQYGCLSEKEMRQLSPFDLAATMDGFPVSPFPAGRPTMDGIVRSMIDHEISRIQQHDNGSKGYAQAEALPRPEPNGQQESLGG